MIIATESGRWDGRLIKYGERELSQLALAYAVTVHRSQGSESPCLVLHDSHYTLLERQLIYTGVTRAKKLLIVVGAKRALTLAVKRAGSRKRCCMLRERVMERLVGGRFNHNRSKYAWFVDRTRSDCNETNKKFLKILTCSIYR